MKLRCKHLGAGSLCGVLICALIEIVHSQPRNNPSAIDLARTHQAFAAIASSPATNFYQGNLLCSGCHSNQGDFPPEVLERACLTEYKTWNNADRHARAFASLSTDRGRNMAVLLAKNVHDPDTGCVQCHTMAVPGLAQLNDQERSRVLFEDGVSCEACHGPSSNWMKTHYDHPLWQSMSLEEKTKAGWIDVRSPVTRAEVCISCHLGSDRYGRVITHEMYAAGHPPLTGFEVESFADKMPRHWRHSYERPKSQAGAALEPSLERTRNVLVASVVALRMAVELTMADATAPRDAGRWPELARLDCFACHHELIEPGWRQSRQVTGTPGRPQLELGCIALVKIAADIADDVEVKNVDALVTRLSQPFDRNVLGDPAMLAEHGAAVVAWCIALEGRLESMSFQVADGTGPARAVLHNIADRASAELHDYDTARQLYGAWIVVYSELVANNSFRLSDADHAELATLLARINRQDPFLLERDRIKPPCELPPETDETTTARGEQLEQAVRKAFTTRVKYDPQVFAKIMASLAELTGE